MFGFRKFNTPVLRPAAPFIVGGVVVFYYIAKIQTAMINSKLERETFWGNKDTNLFTRLISLSR